MHRIVAWLGERRSVAVGAAAAVAVMSAGMARADEWQVLDVNRVRVATDGFVYFGSATRPPSTCSQWGEYFKFDTTTPVGKSMYAILLSAKLSGRQIEIWYPPTKYPDTDQATGCLDLCVPWMIALH